MKTRENVRAEFAFERLSAQQHSSRQTQYGRLCVRLPSLILQNGLCQTLAFLEAKSKPHKPEYKILLTDIAGAVKGQPNYADFTRDVRGAAVTEYRRLSSESLACAVWFKRYAEALLGIEITDDIEDGHD